MVAPTSRVRVSTRRVYALGALAAVLFGYDGGIIGAAILFIPRDLPLPPWQQGVVVGAMGTGLSWTVLMLVLFRLVVGLAIGIASVMVPLYLAEMAPARDRGVITSLNQYMIIVGTALSAALGYAFAFAGSWRWMLLVGVFPAVVLMSGMVVMPDTPRSLVRRGQDDNARAVLVGLRGDAAEAERELAEITAVERQERQTRTTALLS